MDWKFYEGIANEAKRLKEEDANTKIQVEQNEDWHKNCEYVCSPDRGMATIIYIASMIFGTIFNARILIWIVATLIYFNVMNKK